MSGLPMKIALSAGPDLEATDGYGATAFFAALRAGATWAAEKLRNAGANVHATRPQEVLTPTALHAAIASDSPASVAWVLGLGFPVNDDSQDPPLFFAVSEDRVNAARALLAAGAKIHKENDLGQQPINQATSLRMLELLIEYGADINHVDGCGKLPLMEFASRGNATAVRTLLASGAQVDKTSTGKTALHAAVCADNVETVKVLLDAGADVNALDGDSQSVLFRVQSRRMLAFLVAAGIDFKVTLRDECQFPAWHLIADPELADEIKRLAVKAGAYCEDEDKAGHA